VDETAVAKELLRRASNHATGCEMEPEADKLRAELKRWQDLRGSVTEEQAHRALEEVIKETEDRLRQIEMVANDR
jgi:hypothetical protein